MPKIAVFTVSQSTHIGTFLQKLKNKITAESELFVKTLKILQTNACSHIKFKICKLNIF